MKNVAAEHPDVVHRIDEILAEAHVDNVDWPQKSKTAGKRK